MSDTLYMQRAIQLARRGGRYTGSNPNVGAVLVYEHKIIGEGYHREYGGPHAEVNAIQDALNNDHSALLRHSTLYVTLEPCNHHGKTPPCLDLVLKHGIPRVVIGSLDPSPHIAGKSAKCLQESGVDVAIGINSNECSHLIAPFIRHKQGLPFTYLKMAQSSNRVMGSTTEQMWITGALSKTWSHHMRTKVDAILVGTGTAIMDNPHLNVRAVKGNDPLRIILDREGRVPTTHHILSDGRPTLVYTTVKDYSAPRNGVKVIQLDQSRWTLNTIWQHIYNQGINHLLVEGGKQLHQSILKQNLWDEAFVLTSTKPADGDIKSVNIDGKLLGQYYLQKDSCHHIARTT